jgi:hypothetical protein
MVAGTGALLTALGAGGVGIAALTRGGDGSHVTTVGDAPAAPVQQQQQSSPASAPRPAAKSQLGAEVVRSRTSQEADRAATRAPHRHSGGGVPAAAAPAAGPAAGPAAKSAPGAPAPVITTRTEVRTKDIPYDTQVVSDPSLPTGTQQVQSRGVNGVQTLRYLVTLVDGRETGRRLIDSTITRQPQHEIIAQGGRHGPGGEGGAGWGGSGSGGPGGGRSHGDRGRHCGAALNFCVPLGREACPEDATREESTVTADSSVAVIDNELGVLGTENAKNGGCAN